MVLHYDDGCALGGVGVMVGKIGEGFLRLIRVKLRYRSRALLLSGYPRRRREEDWAR